MEDKTADLTNEYIELRQDMSKFRGYTDGDEKLSELIKEQEDPIWMHCNALFAAKREKKDKNACEEAQLRVGVWKKHINSLQELNCELSKDVLIVSLYRYYRTANEAYEHSQIQGGAMQHIEAIPLEGLNSQQKSNPSLKWKQMRYFDARGDNNSRLFQKTLPEYNLLLDIEKTTFDNWNNSDDMVFPKLNMEGASTSSFFSNEVNRWLASLRLQLEQMFGDDPSDEYLKCWHKIRKPTAIGATPNSGNDKFDTYRDSVRRLFVIMKMIVDVHRGPKNFQNHDDFKEFFVEESSLTEEGTRFVIILELLYIHCLISVFPKEANDLSDILTSLDENFSNPNNDNEQVYNFVRSNKKMDHDKPATDFVKGDDGLGYALMFLWLSRAKKLGFYLALASNLQEGDLIANKTEREPESSNWGNKVILKHGIKYIQFAQGILPKDRQGIAKKLHEANIYFLKQATEPTCIEAKEASFGTTKLTFPEVNGPILQNEWNEAIKHKNEAKIMEMFGMAWEFFIRLVGKESVEWKEEEIYWHNQNEDLNGKSKVWFNDIKKALGIEGDAKHNFPILQWVHGDEWGVNFTISPGHKLCAIDLEDCIERGWDDYNIGGTHAKRIHRRKDGEKFPDIFFSPYAAIGRLCAALIQVSLKKRDVGYDGQFKPDELLEIFVTKIDELVDGKNENDPLGPKGVAAERASVKLQIFTSFLGWTKYWHSKDKFKNWEKIILEKMSPIIANIPKQVTVKE